MSLSDLDFPEEAAVSLIVRGDRLIAPKGNTVLLPGDHVYVIAQEEDRPLIQLIFGRPEEELAVTGHGYSSATKEIAGSSPQSSHTMRT